MVTSSSCSDVRSLLRVSGVNDNGAAVVTLLQAAREVSSHTGRNSTALFIAFDFEEWETSGEYT